MRYGTRLNINQFAMGALISLALLGVGPGGCGFLAQRTDGRTCVNSPIVFGTASPFFGAARFFLESCPRANPLTSR